MERPTSWKKWEKKGDPHLINRIQWDQREIEMMMLPFERDWHGYGETQKKLERKLSEFTEIPYFYLTNSGSTAIMTALKILRAQKRFNMGDLVLHPISTFPTSISSAIDFGAVPVFIETKQGAYVADEQQVERAVKKHPEIVGMILPHLLGNIPNMDSIKESLDGRWLIEDSCDTMGGYFDGKHTGRFGDFAAFSFYGSHHITTAGVGGAIGMNNPEVAKMAKSMIFWGHKYYTHNNKNEPNNFLERYATGTIGSDFQMSGIQAGFGLAQIEKLPRFVEARKEQFRELNEIFKVYGKDFFILPESDQKSNPSWFCYPLIVKENAPFTRQDFVNYLTDNHVEIRPVMCGNILRQPAFEEIKRITLEGEMFPIGNTIEERGFFIPAWGMPDNQKEDYHSVIRGFLEKYR